ncbi:UTP15 C terminal-domain-containing protein [Yarrowia lipolytica]|nr:hypothetical protein YALI1_E02203g [Yarrowia lipolytica]KAB8282871.1 UTP15 C terminal-domain-containing protein [Yarrowia lipolytica]KAE8174594.1 UTP15 C terminal-domain-containing protein [Yarrowia lipolytica]RDW29081.1 UTP15 C terminal-domain-containing protein [Yarrowia lipolytica]RDW33447.1 UTP15 C terminal-domain-containing protein [Yarrowia lipolytica]
MHNRKNWKPSARFQYHHHHTSKSTMSAPLNRLTIAKEVKKGSDLTPEQKFWKTYRSPLLVKEYNAISHVSFNHHNDFAVTSSTRIQIFSGKTRKVTKTISRFKDTVYCGEFRSDGKLIVAGDATGLVQIFDAVSRNILVTLQASQLATHVTKFHPTNLTTLLTASDDRSVKLYDITSSTPLIEFEGAQDYVRCGEFVDANVVAAGSYDGTVRLYDARSGKTPISSLAQDHPVEDVLYHNGMVLSAGGPIVKAWDMTTGKTIRQMGNFSKTVTCLAPTHGASGFFAGSLDGHVKVFDDTSFKVTYGWKYGSGVLCTGMSLDSQHIVAGLVSGIVAVRTQQPKKDEKISNGRVLDQKAAVEEEKKKKAEGPVLGGTKYEGQFEHVIVEEHERPNKKLLKRYENLLLGFRWGDALDAALSGEHLETSVLALEELKKRGKVRAALLNRDEDSLEPLFEFATKAIADSRYINIVADYVAVVLDMYTSVITKSPILEERVSEFYDALKSEVETAKESKKIQGMLELLSV